MRYLLLVCALVLASPSLAFARSESEFAYPFSQVWTITIRLLRIDLDCPINEKDKDEGYFLFEYRDDKRTFPGSAELIPSNVGGVKGVRVVIQLAALPQYVERMILDRLARKLDEELGRPMQPQKPKDEKQPSAEKPHEKKPDDKQKTSDNK
jgi:hypothetical protein